MDVVNPGIIAIGKRYYRNNVIPHVSNEIAEDSNHFREYVDEEPCDYDEVTSRFDIEQEGNDFLCNISIAPMFYGFIIGKKGEAKKRIELDTKTTIVIPKHGVVGKVMVKGQNYSLVDRAVSRIMDAVEHGRQVLPFTHFLSIAANNEAIQARFERFQCEVLHSCLGDRGVSDKLFQNAMKLHLTLTTLVLGDHDELDGVVGVVEQFRRQNGELFERPLTVRVRGLEYMNDDPCEVRVLYGKIDNGLDRDKLQQLSDSLVDFLTREHALGRSENRSVTLHMTVMNASFVSQRDLALDVAAAADGIDNVSTFDCSNIVRKFADWDFGELRIDEICLSRRHGGTANCYYNSAASFKFGC